MRLARVLETGSIRSRLMGALVLLALVPVLVLVVCLVFLGHISGDARRIELAASLRMGGFVVAAQINSHVADPAAAKLRAVGDEFARMEAALAALESGSEKLHIARVGDAESRTRIAAVRAALAQCRELVQRVVIETRPGRLAPERRTAISDEVLGSAYALLATTQRLVQALENRSAAALRLLWALQAIAVLVALIVLLLTLWAVNRYILQPIPPLVAALGELQAGRYGAHVEVRGENELSAVAAGFNAMSNQLQQAHRQLVMKQVEILEKNAELERASKLKSQFVANMSHELRTPLNAIIGYTKLLRSGVFGPLPARVQEPLQGIDETSGTLLRLINDILDVAKIEAGKMGLHLETFRVQDVVQEIGEMLRPLALGKGLEMQVRTGADVPPITTDRDKLRRVLLNLAGNAVKFTRRGTVEIELLPPRPASAGDPQACFAVAVRDTGIGIAPEHMEIIFEDFHQLDGSAAREHAGSGLGLAISRRLARHLGGDIQVESHVGKGSAFELRLPLRPRPDTPMPHGAAPAA